MSSASAANYAGKKVAQLLENHSFHHDDVNCLSTDLLPLIWFFDDDA
jgi:hypothetical protein